MTKRKLVLREVSDPRVLAAMEAVPRHRFVPAQYAEDAYDDHPLPIGYGQTISQPYIVALMTQLLELKGHEKVLEIGAGSGYQAAILSLLAREVFTVERIPQLAEKARERLSELGYRNVHIRIGDGYEGWPEHAPYDAIIVTCAAEEVPPPLIEQLADGGRLVIPVGESGWSQRLMLLRKRGAELEQREIAGVVFVPLVRGVAQPPENAGGPDES
ncbi:MAG: protein-L-isoaspartate(D-aspartate) O-methyltransferase [Chloroflexi bacterium]|nr:protein-L-isoaspartate(D-aspartate) O-methyltransferase [Chloroflexota bacterium]